MRVDVSVRSMSLRDSGQHPWVRIIEGLDVRLLARAAIGSKKQLSKIRLFENVTELKLADVSCGCGAILYDVTERKARKASAL